MVFSRIFSITIIILENQFSSSYIECCIERLKHFFCLDTLFFFDSFGCWLYANLCTPFQVSSGWCSINYCFFDCLSSILFLFHNQSLLLVSSIECAHNVETYLVRSKNRCTNPVLSATSVCKISFGAARGSLEKEGLWAHANAKPPNIVKHVALHSDAFIKSRLSLRLKLSTLHL